MRLPAPLLRRKSNVYKNTFGHTLILAGSKQMLGAAALTSLAAIRAGSGLVTVGIPNSLNAVIQKKISNTIMTWPLKETPEQTISSAAFKTVLKDFPKYNSIAIGPGLSTHRLTQKFILNVIEKSPNPLVIDADALSAIATNLKILKSTKIAKVITPHPGEMTKLLKCKKAYVQENRAKVAKEFALKYQCTVVLKGHKSIVASEKGVLYTNTSGNSGMATAGSGDVLTGIITAFMAQGLKAFEAAKFGTYLHGVAGDLTAKHKTRLGMIASDIVDYIPQAIKKCS